LPYGAIDRLNQGLALNEIRRAKVEGIVIPSAVEESSPEGSLWAAPLAVALNREIKDRGTLSQNYSNEANYLKQYHVYIMSSANRAVYVGVTDNLLRRVSEHKGKEKEGHTKSTTKRSWFTSRKQTMRLPPLNVKSNSKGGAEPRSLS
jgi:hypothetical protein